MPIKANVKDWSGISCLKTESETLDLIFNENMNIGWLENIKQEETPQLNLIIKIQTSPSHTTTN